MDEILAFAKQNNVRVIEDAAHGIWLFFTKVKRLGALEI